MCTERGILSDSKGTSSRSTTLGTIKNWIVPYLFASIVHTVDERRSRGEHRRKENARRINASKEYNMNDGFMQQLSDRIELVRHQAPQGALCKDLESTLGWTLVSQETHCNHYYCLVPYFQTFLFTVTIEEKNNIASSGCWPVKRHSITSRFPAKKIATPLNVYRGTNAIIFLNPNHRRATRHSWS